MIKPKQMCNQHLLGEHFEIHKAVGNLRHSGKWTKSLTEKGFLEPQNFLARHNELVEEMLARSFNHNSPLKYARIRTLFGKVDVQLSINDLKKRCAKCNVEVHNR